MVACLIVPARQATDVPAPDRLYVVEGLSVMENVGIACITDRGAKKAFSNAKG